MSLFGFGKKEEKKQNCCCGGNCTDSSMQTAENEKNNNGVLKNVPSTLNSHCGHLSSSSSNSSVAIAHHLFK